MWSVQISEVGNPHVSVLGPYNLCPAKQSMPLTDVRFSGVDRMYVCERAKEDMCILCYWCIVMLECDSYELLASYEAKGGIMACLCACVCTVTQ
jgi:hypothetical protein